jgi:hypothetical protein
MNRDDATYYCRRALEERLAARKATCAAARERHQELATMYQLRADTLAAGAELRSEESSTAAREELA